MNPRIKLILCLFVVSEICIPYLEKKHNNQNLTFLDLLVFYASHFTIKGIIAQEIVSYIYSLFET